MHHTYFSLAGAIFFLSIVFFIFTLVGLIVCAFKIARPRPRYVERPRELDPMQFVTVPGPGLDGYGMPLGTQSRPASGYVPPAYASPWNPVSED